MAPDDESSVQVRTFLIADIRGFTQFTRQRGDEAAAALAGEFAALTREIAEGGGGRLLELRGDEALAVFTSTRQALRSAVELQRRFAEHSAAEPDRPLPVGIGIDAGEAVPVGDGYRGGALNMAARLCGVAGPGEILTTEVATHLAGTIDGVSYVDRGPQRLKGMDARVRVMGVHPAGGEIVPAAQRRPAVAGRSEVATSIEKMADEFTRRLSERVQTELATSLGDSMRNPVREPDQTPGLPLPVTAITVTGVVVGGIIALALIVAVVVIALHL